VAENSVSYTTIYGIKQLQHAVSVGADIKSKCLHGIKVPLEGE
jgi:hypothetical protein